MANVGDAFNPKLNGGKCDFNGHSDLVVRPNGELAVTYQNQNTRI